MTQITGAQSPLMTKKYTKFERDSLKDSREKLRTKPDRRIDRQADGQTDGRSYESYIVWLFFCSF